MPAQFQKQTFKHFKQLKLQTFNFQRQSQNSHQTYQKLSNKIPFIETPRTRDVK